MARMRFGIAALVVLCQAAVAEEAADDHPLVKDKTGMKWVLPFTKARATAREQGRLLLIKPVAFGTSADGGW